MRDPSRTKAALILAALCLAPAAALAQSPPGSDWPCIQRRVAAISPGAVWSGPDFASAGDWSKDFEAAALAQKLASRRTTLDEADSLIDEFAKSAGAEKVPRLTRVFAGVLELTNTERSRILSGIERYAKGQKRLADRIREESDKLGESVDSPMSELPDAMKDVQTAMKWDARIFDERKRSLAYVCEVPVLLEKRVFEIGRRIQARL
jgi:hypothetical protein